MQKNVRVQHPVAGEEIMVVCKEVRDRTKGSAVDDPWAHSPWFRGKPDAFTSFSLGLLGNLEVQGTHMDQWLTLDWCKGNQTLSWEASLKEVWEAVVERNLL